MKTTMGVVFCALWLTHAAVSLPAAAVPDDPEALKLLQQAGIAYSIEDDYAKALELLSRAANSARSEAIRGRVLVETAYVHWMRIDSPKTIHDLLVTAAAEIGPPGEGDERFPQAFRKIWKRAARVKAKPRIPRFHVTMLINVMASNDSRFAAAYGRWQWVPELRLGFSVHRQWRIWATFSTFSFSGVLPVIDMPTEGFQRFLAAGVSWCKALGKDCHLLFSLGPEWVTFEEKNLLEGVRENRLGARFRGELQWGFTRGLYGSVVATYDMARATIRTYTVRPGGFSLGLGLGVDF